MKLVCISDTHSLHQRIPEVKLINASIGYRRVDSGLAGLGA
ncbi:hypothetical protein ACT3RL_01790 [Halomonas sp. AOP5-CZ2-32]|jgi:hypothetical protein